MKQKRGGLRRVGKNQWVKYGGLSALTVAALGVSGVALTQANPQDVPAAAPKPSASKPATAKALPTVTAKRKDGKPLRTLFAGDSLTGALYASVQEKGFKWLMLDQLEKSGPVEEFNSAISGGTTLDVSSKYDVPKNLDLAVVELGTNDMGKPTPLAEFGDAYDDLLNRITSGSPGVALVCAGVWEANGGSPSGPSYDGVIMNRCQSHGGVFVPLRPLYQDPATIGPAGLPAFTGESDMFHPNDTGHRKIADALLARIKIS